MPLSLHFQSLVIMLGPFTHMLELTPLSGLLTEISMVTQKQANENVSKVDMRPDWGNILAVLAIF